jgi:hypothetical protein
MDGDSGGDSRGDIGRVEGIVDFYSEKILCDG